MDPGRELAAYRLEQQIARRTRRAWEAALGGRSSLPSPMSRVRTAGGGVPQAPIVVGAPPQAALLILTASGDSIADGGDYVDADSLVYEHGFPGASVGDAVPWPFDAIGEIQVEYAWDSYTGATTIEVEVDGVVPPWGTIFDAVSGAGGVKRRGVHIAAGAEVKILVTQESGSAKTGDFEVEYIIPGPALGVVADPPGTALGDHFDFGAPLPSTTGTIDGRVLEDGSGVWIQDHGVIAIFSPSYARGMDDDFPADGFPRAVVETGFSDGEVYVEVGPILETNSPAFRNGLVFRYVDDSNYWHWVNYRSPISGLLYFWHKVVAGVVTSSGALTAGARDTGGVIPMKVVLDGSSIEFWYDGVLRDTVVDAAHVGATKHGITTYGYAVDYFLATPAG